MHKHIYWICLRSYTNCKSTLRYEEKKARAVMCVWWHTLQSKWILRSVNESVIRIALKSVGLLIYRWIHRWPLTIIVWCYFYFKCLGTQTNSYPNGRLSTLNSTIFSRSYVYHWVWSAFGIIEPGRLSPKDLHTENYCEAHAYTSHSVPVICAFSASSTFTVS